MKVEINLFHM